MGGGLRAGWDDGLYFLMRGGRARLIYTPNLPSAAKMTRYFPCQIKLPHVDDKCCKKVGRMG